MSEEAKILVIDDDESMRDSCKQVFSTNGYRIETAENGHVGLDKFEDFTPDIVLLDLKMPGLSGLEVLKTLHERNADCIIIVITGYGTIDSAVEAMKIGAYDFLPKPFTPSEIRIIVSRGLERLRTIQESERLRAEKEQMRKLFVSMASHELRSPLAAVQQNLMVITGGMAGDIPSKVEEMLLRMQGRIKGLIALISDWLDLSRIESGEMITGVEAVDLTCLTAEVIDTLSPLAENKRIKIMSERTGSHPPVLGNWETLQMLLMNLVNNAIKYNHEDGEIEVGFEVVGDEVKISVRDTGIGIPEEKLHLIFEAFFRTKDKNNVEGSGLGLSIVHRIVEAHEGRIDVVSEPGKGTTFFVYLPQFKEASDVKGGDS